MKLKSLIDSLVSWNTKREKLRCWSGLYFYCPPPHFTMLWTLFHYSECFTLRNTWH